MSLSRKRKRELKKLKKLTDKLIGEQREVISHAGSVLNEAGVQARNLNNEHLAPRVRGALGFLSPGLKAGAGIAKGIGSNILDATRPATEKAFASTLELLEANNQKDAAKRLRKFGQKQGFVKKNRGIGWWIAGIIGGLVAAGIGYSLWQAFREDENTWFAAEDSLAEKAEKVTEKVSEKVSETAGKVSETAGKVTEKAEEAFDKAKETVKSAVSK